MSDKPAEKPTVEIEVPPKWAIAMSEKMESGFRGLRADIQVVANDVGVVKDRVVILEKWKIASEERASKNSQRVQMTSENDLKQDAAIATLVTDMATVKTDVGGLKETQGTQLAILERLDKVAANPIVRRVAYAIAGAVLSYLVSKGWVTK